MKYAEDPLPHLLDLVQDALRDESRIHHVVGPVAGTGKSLVAAALAEHAGRQGFAARLLNVDVKRRIPPAYEALLRTPSVHFSVEGPLEPAAAEKRVAEAGMDNSGRFVFDYGPWQSMESASLPESGRSIVVVGPRGVPMRALRAFVKRLRIPPAEVRWVFNEQPVSWNETVFYPETG